MLAYYSKIRPTAQGGSLARIRPMRIGLETNGHWAGDQWALNPDSMPIGFEFNAHWISE